MTEVRLKCKDNLYGFEVSGHATGKQEVCSAISHTMYSLAEYLEKCTNRVRLVACEFGNAFAKIEFSGGTEAEEIFNLVASGLMLMEKEMGNFIKIL